MSDLNERASDGQELVELINSMDGMIVTDWSMHPKTPSRSDFNIDVNINHRKRENDE